jgi:hypothetical protein
MKHIGKGNLWSKQDIIQFIKDETLESTKSCVSRMYYSFILLCNNEVIGFIAGRKNKALLPKNISPYDLLLRMFISSTHSGKGYGKLLLKLFIKIYSKIVSKEHELIKLKSTNKAIQLFSDIDKKNIPSIKIHLANDFIFNSNIKYPNGKYYNRYLKHI